MSAADDSARVLVTPDDLIGFAIDGKYRLDAILGGGGMGVVYRTTQENLNREIAIKLLKLEDASEESRLGRFRREIDIVAQLTHPNIVRVFDSGRDPELGLHYIAMELVDGTTLDDVLRGNRLAPTLAIDIAHQVCAALTEPHRMGIIHRDIKPANILLTSRSDDTIGVKVVDFGIARGVSAEASGGKITTTGVVVGSPMYMAPEVARGESLDARTDLYSLGVLLYEMLTGDTPFRGSTPVAIMLRHAVDEPPSLGEAVDDDFHFPELVELVDSMLSKDRRRRPSDAKEVLRRLDAIRNAHHLGRVAIDGSRDPLRALAPFTLTVDRSDADEMQTDPFSPTTPFTESEEPRPSSGSDSFAGWLVPEAARDRLTGKHQASQVDVETSVEPTGNERAKAIVAGLVIVAMVVAAATAYFIGVMRPDPRAGQGDTQPTIDPAPTAAKKDGPAADERAKPDEVVAQPSVPDVGDAPDAAARSDATPGEEVAPTEKPASKPPTANESGEREEAKPTRPEQDDEETKSDEFDEGMKWLHEK